MAVTSLHPSSVTLIEVGPRDGLQSAALLLETPRKLAWIQALAEAGLRQMEVASFVNPRRVPQMADAALLMQGLRQHWPLGAGGPAWAVLVPNLQGWEAARQTQPDEVVVFGACTETFSQRNIQCSVQASLERFEPVVAQARAQGVRVRAALSCALHCPFEGEVPHERVAQVAGWMAQLGVQTLSLADTTGRGTPRRVQKAFEAALRHFPLRAVSAHFHDTYGQALANALACLDMGVHCFETSAGGLGGCPFAPGAQGNLATEDLVFMLHGLGIDTGVSLDALVDASAMMAGWLGAPTASRCARALLASRVFP